jgi:hypothetical protein
VTLRIGICRVECLAMSIQTSPWESR